jgi:hypothetical protein
MYFCNRAGSGQQCPEPFGQYAPIYYEQSLPVFPCGGIDGKTPLIRSWKPYQTRMPSQVEIDRWLCKFPTANIAIITGNLSGITVIDCDDESVAPDKIMRRFGDTGIAVKSTRGFHLYYCSQGEASRQHIEPDIDIKGNGGYIIAPPSYNPSKDASYTLWKGGLTGLKNQLSPIKDGAIAEIDSFVGKGNRNNALFSYLASIAHEIDSYDKLLDMAICYNQNICTPPDNDSKVKATAKGVWKYKLEGKLFRKGQQFIRIGRESHREFASNTDASWLYYDLQTIHFARTEPFALAVEAYSKAIGWSPKRFRKAVKSLMEINLIRRVHKGGRCKGDAHLYELC